MGALIEVSSKEEFVNNIKTGLSLVDFFAVWCGPCQMMKPVIHKMAEEMADVNILTVDVDKFSELAGDYQVMSIPTFVLFKDGQPIESKHGAMPEIELKNWIEKNR